MRFVVPVYLGRSHLSYGRRVLDDPAAAAWAHAGQPGVPAPVQWAAEPCARCGIRGEGTVSSRRIISEQFTGYDSWPFGLRRLCVPCAWAYNVLAPRDRVVWTITPTRTVAHDRATELLPLLSAGRLPGNTAVVLSVQRNHFVLPHAAWGRLTVDRLTVDWTAHHAYLLGRVAWLRALGFSWVQLGEQLPPAGGLRRHPPARWVEIGDAWQQLRPWRGLPAMWAAARTVTAAPN